MSRPPWTLQPPQEQVGPDLPLARRRTSLITLAIGVPTLILLWLYALLYQRDNLLLLYVPLLLAVLLLGYLTQWLAGSSRASSERGPAWLILGATAAALVYRLAFPAQFDAWLQMFAALLVVSAAGFLTMYARHPQQIIGFELLGSILLFIVAGLLLVLLAAFSWGLYFVLQRRFSGRYGVLTTVCYMVWCGTLLLSVYAPGLAQAVVQASWRVNLAVLLLGLFPSALAYLAWAYVLARVEVSRASIAMYLIPPVAMLLAATVLGETLQASVLLGAAVVLGSVMAMPLEGRWRRGRAGRWPSPKPAAQAPAGQER